MSTPLRTHSPHSPTSTSAALRRPAAATSSPPISPSCRQISTGVIGALNREWEHLRDTPTPSHWPASLTSSPTVGAVLDRIRSCRSSEADAALHALLTLHAQGHELAGRMVLQSMLGKVVKLARTAVARGFVDPDNTVVELMWTAVHTYPLTRTSCVAGNLALDALHLMDQRAPAREIPISNIGDPDCNAEDLLEWLMTVNESADAAAAREAEERQRRLVETLHWAVQHQVLSADDVRLLARVHLGIGAAARHETMRSIAADMRTSHTALRKRHSRAVQALSAAVVQRLHV